MTFPRIQRSQNSPSSTKNMPSRTFEHPPKLLTIKPHIDSNTQSVVDSVLKSLRSSSKKLQALGLAQTEELRILERLFYKGKNQHRQALFWRNVVEIRRLARRVEEVDAYGLVNSLRLGFYEADLTLSPKSTYKLLKGVWVCYPGQKYVSAILRRIRDIIILLKKSRLILERGYQYVLLMEFINQPKLVYPSAFTLSMQDTAFLPQSVTLMAIASRLEHLRNELQALLEEILLKTQPLAESVQDEIPVVSKSKKGVVGAQKLTTGNSYTDLPTPDISAIQSHESTTPTFVSRIPGLLENLDSTASAPLLRKVDITTQGTSSHSVEILHVVKSTTSMVPTKRKPAEPDKPKKPKKKLKRNEIDDIFG